MQHHLKLNPDPKAEGAQGQARQDFLIAFLAMQMRVKSGESVVTHSHKIEEKNDKETKKWEWSAEQMDINMGALCFLQTSDTQPPIGDHRT